jgi:cytochrome c oxidase assembly protein subunit 11
MTNYQTRNITQTTLKSKCNINLSSQTQKSFNLLNKSLIGYERLIISIRHLNNNSKREAPTDNSSSTSVWYIMGSLILMLGFTYAAVPLYKIFCESQGTEATTAYRDDPEQRKQLAKILTEMKRDENRLIEVEFVATTNIDLNWNFKPSQSNLFVAPGETALAFFKAKNLTDRPIVGIGSF